MADDLNLETKYTVTAKGLENLDKGKAKTKGLRQETDKLAKSAKSAGAAGAGMTKALLGFVAFGTISTMVVGAIKDLALLERRFIAMNRQFESMGLNGEATTKRLRDFTLALEQQTGVVEDQSLPTFQKFVGLLGDVDGAMAGTKLAADLSNAGFGEMNVVTEQLAGLLTGRAASAAKFFGIQADEMTGELGSAEEMFQQLIDRASGFSEEAGDVQSDLEDLNSTWSQLSKTIGGAFSPAIAGVNKGLQIAIGVIKSLGTIIGSSVDGWISLFRGLGRTIGAVFNLKKLLTEGPGEFLASIRFEVRRTMRDIEIVGQTAAEGIKQNFNFAKAELEDTAEGLDTLLEVAAAKSAAARQEKEDKARADAERKEAERLLRVEQLERQSRDRLLAMRIAGSEKGSAEQLRLQKELLDNQRDAAVAAANQLGADTAAIEETFRLAKLSLDEQQAAAEKDAETKKMEQRLAFERQTLATIQDLKVELAKEFGAEQEQLLRDRLAMELEIELEAANAAGASIADVRRKHGLRVNALERNLADGRKAMAEEEATATRERNAAGAQAAISGALGAFGQKKGIQIAEALMNTYQGASKALADWGFPLGPIFAALMVVAGIKQVQAIKKQEPGQGFDDAASDRLAFLGGKRWAQDMVDQITAGWRTGLQEAVETTGAPTTTSIRNEDNRVDRSTTFTGPVFGGRAGLREFSRIVSRGDREDQGRTVR